MVGVWSIKSGIDQEKMLKKKRLVKVIKFECFEEMVSELLFYFLSIFST